jgi:hypothetical protein
VIYYPSGKIPSQVLTTEELWILGDWGVFQEGDIKFGYTYTFEQLSEMVKKHDIPLTGVHAFYYDRGRKSLKDISEETRQMLKEADKL